MEFPLYTLSSSPPPLPQPLPPLLESSWNVMAHGDVWEGKRRGNWWMEWVASTLHITSEHCVSSITTADAHTSPASSRLNWLPRRFKRTRPFHRKTRSGFCACAITFQMQSTITITIVTSTLDILQLAAQYTRQNSHLTHTILCSVAKMHGWRMKTPWQKAQLAVIELYLQYEWQNRYESSGLLRELDQHLHAVETQRIVLCCRNQLYGTNNYL